MSSRLRSRLVIVTVAMASIAAFVGLFVLILNVSDPDTAELLGLGAGELSNTVDEEARSVSNLLGLRPLLDLSLLLGSYVLISLLAWLQHQISSYLANARHFK